MKSEKSSSNIWKLYLIKATRSFMLIMPVIVLFFKENGLSMKEIFILQSLFSVSVILLEIPTGYFSDIFGRKKSIIIGGALASLGFGIYSLSYGFWGFLSAEIILGFGMSFISGADCAMLYDTLLEKGRGSGYKKAEGRGSGFGLFSEGAASVIGGFLALTSLRIPLYWDTLATFMIIPIALTLSEPERHADSDFKNSIKNMIRLIKYCLYDNGELKWLIFYSSTVAASTLTMCWFIQPYMAANSVPLEFFGVVWAGLLFTAAVCSWNAHRIEKFLGRKISLAILIAFPALGYLFLSSFWYVWSGIFLLFFYVTRGINNPVTLDYINGLISSDKRATILSVNNLVGRLIFSIFGPIAGWINDIYSLKAALIVSGAVFFFLGLISLINIQKICVRKTEAKY